MNLKHAFPGQKPEEEVFLFIRRHWLSFLPHAIISILMLVLPAVLYFLVKSQMPEIIKGDIAHYATLALSAYMLFISTFFLVNWIDYYFDILIVTNERLVHIQQKGLFNRHISELNLIQVQNVSTEIKGFLPTFFDFGLLIVQTAGESTQDPNHKTSSDFTMENIPSPNKLSQTILKLHEDMLKKQNQPIHHHPKPVPPPSTNNIASQTAFSADSGNNDNYNTHSEQPHFQKNINPVNQSPLKEIADEGQLKEGEIIDL